MPARCSDVSGGLVATIKGLRKHGALLSVFEVIDGLFGKGGTDASRPYCRMQLTRWRRFRWDLTRLDSTPETPTRFTIRPALKEDEDVIKKVILSAFSMDLAWADAFKSLTPEMLKTLEEQFPLHPEYTQVALHGSRIIGVSSVTPEAEASNHLITGPCILHEYRSRGIGSALLRASLESLRQAGLSHAFGITADRTIAARFVYSKFGGTAEKYETGAQPGPQIAA